ncbi:hypothetical protein EYF80_038709 [Liparis tanakae]|uniref:Uncharacterized protein n=1 Tax=Liparis tanakae TaxID=230148 RepID=A0A4Z2GDU5_9TELE|nr:hypothetical protein EYF80_038709 [Liparis tanakae]
MSFHANSDGVDPCVNEFTTVALQACWFGEKSGVPGEITLPVRVLDVQPDDVVRDVVAIESGVHSLHVGLVVVVPAALVVPECKQGGEGLIP